MVWYSRLFKSFLQTVMIHTVKGFSIVNETKVDSFLELPCFLYDPVNVNNLISGSSAFSKPSLDSGTFSQWVQSLSHVRPSATPWTAAFQPPPSMGFFRQEYWSGMPLPSPVVMCIGELILHYHWGIFIAMELPQFVYSSVDRQLDCFQMFKLDLEKAKLGDQIANISCIIEKAREFQ